MFAFGHRDRIKSLAASVVDCHPLGVLIRYSLSTYLLLFLAASAFAQNFLPAPWQQKVLTNAFASHRSFPQIGNGYLWSFRPKLAEGDHSDAIYLNLLARNQPAVIQFWIDGASDIWINDVAVSPDHSMLVAGSYFRSAEGSENHFVAQLDLTGRTLLVTNLGQYEPEEICATNDGTVWTFGQDWNAELRNDSYLMLRNYSADGQLLRSYVPRQDIPLPAVDLSGRFHQAGLRRGRTFLRCGEKSVGIYVGLARMWFELSLSNGDAKSWSATSGTRVPFAENGADPGRPARSANRMSISGFALVGEHEVYASITGLDQTRLGVAEGLFRLDLGSDARASWEPVPGAPSPGWAESLARLVGSDGSSLVYLRNASNSPDGLPFCCGDKYYESNPLLLWSKPVIPGAATKVSLRQ